MAADGDTRQYDGISTYPHVIANGNGLCRDTLLVDAQLRIVEVMIEGCHGNALCQIDMTTDSDWPYDGVVQANTCVVADDNIAYGIVDTGERFDYATGPQGEAAIGWSVHPHGTVDDRTTSTMLIEGSYHTYIPSRTSLRRMHDKPVNQFFQRRALL